VRFLPAVLAFALAMPVAAAEEVPFVVTPDNVTLAMLQIAKVGTQDYVIDLGSGDGRIVITAARRFGANGLGVELVADLVEKSRAAARAAGVEQRARFREMDLFQADLRPATVVTMYLLPEVNLQLRPRLLALAPGTRVVSHDWDMGEWKPDKTVVVDAPDKSVGVEKKSRIHLWIVPARIDGTWCGAGKAKGARLEIQQQFQNFSAELVDGADRRPFVGTIEGNVVRVPKVMNITHDPRELKVTYAIKSSNLQGARFVRPRASGGCR
jgi:SAM-dependent methyltransferase